MADEDIDQNITITGDASGGVQAIDSTTEAFDRFIGKHNELKSVFSQRIEHAGLYLFSRQVLGMVGLADVARHTMGVITMAAEGAAAAFGLAASTLGVATLAIGAAIIVYEKLSKSADKAADSIDKLKRSQDGALAKTVADAQNQERSDRLQIASKESLRQAEIELMDSTLQGASNHEKAVRRANELSQEIAILRDNMKAEHDIALQGIADLHARAEGYQNAADKVSELKLEEDELARNEEKLREGRVKSELAFQTSMSKMREEQLKYQIDLDKMAQRTEDRMGAAAQVTSVAFQSMASAVGNDFAKMVVESKNAADAFKNLWRDVEESFISLVVQMIEKWLIFSALTGGGASVPFASSFVGVNPGTFGGAKAVGVDTFVDRPTSFIAGEAGIERVTVSPMGGGGSSPAAGGGGSTVNHVSVAVNVQTNADPNAIGQAVIKAIRGQGQLQFVRTT